MAFLAAVVLRFNLGSHVPVTGQRRWRPRDGAGRQRIGPLEGFRFRWQQSGMNRADMPEGLPIEELNVHADFLRGLARALLGGDAYADDVVQEAMVVGLQSGPRDPARVRGWLAGIVRNLSLAHRRSERRRRHRHENAPPPAPPSQPAEVLRAFEDLGATVMVPTQWGVLELGDEAPAWSAHALKLELADAPPALREAVRILPVGGRLMLISGSAPK